MIYSGNKKNSTQGQRKNENAGDNKHINIDGGRQTTKETECKRKQVEEKNRLSVGRKAGKADSLWCRKLQQTWISTTHHRHDAAHLVRTLHPDNPKEDTWEVGYPPGELTHPSVLSWVLFRTRLWLNLWINAMSVCMCTHLHCRPLPIINWDDV